MSLLTDQQITEAVKGGKLINGYDPQVDWFADKSPVQPCSADLHVGNINIPCPLDSGIPNERTFVKTDGYSLPPGGTVVVVTREDVSLPNDTAAIAFPASGVSFRGILMTNPGHIDPGYSGKLRFTIINMGSESFPLSPSTVICTLLLFKLERRVNVDWSERGKVGDKKRMGESPKSELVNRLSHDFLSVDDRAEKRATSVVVKAGFIVTIIALLPSLWTLFKSDDELPKLQKEISEIRALLSVSELKTNIAAIELRLNSLETASTNNVGSPKR